jgi:hypothetical protein
MTEQFEEKLRKDMHQLYLFGAAMQLKRMGYHMTNPTDLNAFSYEGFEYAPTLGEPDFPHFNNFIV